MHDGGVGSPGGRALIEDAVRLLLLGVSPGWVRLHAEFEPSAVPALGSASVVMGDLQSYPVVVSPGVLGLIAECQRQAAAEGVPWRRLVIDCGADGSLNARTEQVADVASVPGGSEGRARRVVRWGLTAVSVGCASVAALVFAVAWRWSPPPRLDPDPLPPPPLRQQEALAVIKQWFEAEGRGDVVALRSMVCADPAPLVAGWLQMMEADGNQQRRIVPEAIVQFEDRGASVWARIASRIHPISGSLVNTTQPGFYHEEVVLANEDSTLKVCQYTP